MSLFLVVFSLVIGAFGVAAGCLLALALPPALALPLLSVSTSVVVSNVSPPPSSLLGLLTGHGGRMKLPCPPPASLRFLWARFGVHNEAMLPISRAVSKLSFPGGSEAVWTAFTFRFHRAGPLWLASLESALPLANVGGILGPSRLPPDPWLASPELFTPLVSSRGSSKFSPTIEPLAAAVPAGHAALNSVFMALPLFLLPVSTLP